MIFRHDPSVRVVGFTAAQIPNIEGREYPHPLSGGLYPAGIPIFPQAELADLIRELEVDRCLFSYSDVSNEQVMGLAAQVLSAGADFRLARPCRTMLDSSRPVISVTAVRTGCGKSPTTRFIARDLKRRGLKPVVVRHPMPYGDLSRQVCQRFEVMEDMIRHNCTVEEREEYEQFVRLGIPVLAGVDYGKVLEEAESGADVVIWDGGNNDTPFFRPDLDIVILDPLRPGHEVSYYPGLLNFIRGGVLIINKVGQAGLGQIETLYRNIARHNPTAEVLQAESIIDVKTPELIRGKRVLVVEDGPTLTHGGMTFGAALVAAEQYGAAEVIEPARFAEGTIQEAYSKYPHLKRILPALGYFPAQLEELRRTIERSDADLVLIGTPIDLAGVIDIEKPTLRVSYSTKIVKGRRLEHILDEFLEMVMI